MSNRRKKTFVYRANKGGWTSSYHLAVGATSRRQADKQVKDIEPKESTVTFVSVHDGGLEDYLGSETCERIEKKKSTYRQEEAEKKKSRDRARRISNA